MKLRKLEKKDASLMLEWMHDPMVVADLQGNFLEKSIYDCEKFIQESQNNSESIHLAIVDDFDTYMGTVSLKNINMPNKSAEFAITTRRIAMGKGYSKKAMNDMINIGLDRINLDLIYWCVSRDNYRAIRFYDKCGYGRINKAPNEASKFYSETQIKSYLWYQFSRK